MAVVSSLIITIIIIVIIITTTARMMMIINLIYIAQFDTSGILTALCIVIKYIHIQYAHIML